jgi:HlyD family secretion protein
MLMRTPRRPGRTSVLLLLLVAAASFGAGAVAYWLYAAAPPLPESGDRPANTSAQVVALGRLRPATDILPISGPPGDQIARIAVEEGAKVAKGQPLVELASKADREIEVALLDQQIASAEQQQQLAVADAKRELALANAKLNELNTVAPLEIKAQELGLQALDQKAQALSDQLRKMEALQRSSPATVPEQDIRTVRVQRDQAQAEHEAGKALLEKAKAARESGVALANLQLEAAQAHQERAQNDKSVAALRKKLELANLQLKRTTLTAPWPGTVLKVSGVTGELTAPQQPILQLADTTAMVVVAEVYETDIERLRQAGQVQATIRSRALPKDLKGTVTRVGRLIARNTVLDIDPTADADRRVFEVLVALDAPSSEVAGKFLNLQVQVFFETK